VQRATILIPTLTGLTSGELPARLRGITPAARRAILAIAFAGKAHPKGRYWYAAGHPAPILSCTIRVLRARGLMAGTVRAPSGLTGTGHWFARTLITEIGNTRAEERTICHAES
jgi:hypothetical protein